MNSPRNPFALDKLENRALKFALQKISKLNTLEAWYDEWLETAGSDLGKSEPFIAYTLGKLGLSIETINEELLDSIPETGSFIIVANHPLGGIEGMILTQLLKRHRPDLKVMTNELLSSIPEFSDVFIGVDVLNANQAQRNAKSMRLVAKHLGSGGALLVFPAGTVSHIKIPSLKIVDAPWTNMISRLARKYTAPVMPIYVEGRNSLLFYLSAYIHKRLRTLLLPRAMVAKKGDLVKLHIGQPIPAKDIQRLREDSIAMSYIRLCCKVMSVSSDTDNRSGHEQMDTIKQVEYHSEALIHLKTLDEFKLSSNGSFDLYCVPYDRMGPIMEQLSIEREKTFRAVDEGTGKELDSDQFDPHYMHLFLWDTEDNKIAGGYRLSKTDHIVKKLGLKGLYSHSLFDYNQEFLRNLGKTIEVGRSFVVKEYQKNPTALDALLQGIGRYVAKNPEYHTLFGCVSISRQYSNLASAMLTEMFLSNYGVDEKLSRKVRARIPLNNINNPWTTEQLKQLSDMPIINKLVGRIDPGKTVPVLIRHYLTLNGKFLSFTVNDGFNDAVDGLIMVDLRQTPERYVKRYLGKEGASNFMEMHRVEGATTEKKQDG